MSAVVDLYRSLMDVCGNSSGECVLQSSVAAIEGHMNRLAERGSRILDIHSSSYHKH
jgi:hypothetical protein